MSYKLGYALLCLVIWFCHHDDEDNGEENDEEHDDG